MRKGLFFSFVTVLCINAFASDNIPVKYQMFGNSMDSTSSVEYKWATEQIQRICPTCMWDSWVFRQIWYDEDDKSVVFAIQLDGPLDANYLESKTGGKSLTQFTLEGFCEGYKLIQDEHSCLVDGDFMLYLSIGFLLNNLKQSKEEVGLRMIFFQPDSYGIINENDPGRITGDSLKQLFIQ